MFIVINRPDTRIQIDIVALVALRKVELKAMVKPIVLTGCFMPRHAIPSARGVVFAGHGSRRLPGACAIAIGFEAIHDGLNVTLRPSRSMAQLYGLWQQSGLCMPLGCCFGQAQTLCHFGIGQIMVSHCHLMKAETMG
ncbi:hypothetical protein [Ruegeria arenilitoris]|uniref:hypothetical protein n=1 Tax=Ruegeria arenilitoris TaxID=1173585 RepID=UPI00147F7AA7|nr:hypothetical protein [Ruegeria arenilitoris]